MKALYLSAIGIALGSSAIAQERCCQPGSNTPRVFRDAATHDTIVGNARPRPNPISSMRRVVMPEEVKVSEAPKPESILARSEVLYRGNIATLIPKRAVLHLPSGLRGALARPAEGQGVKFVQWSQFYAANRSWIRTVEVTRAQAEGMEAMPEETVEKFKESREMIVATYQTGPISVMPVKEPEAATATTDETTTAVER
ncbi:hypothetical protein HAHE_30020 [Haloferula helveola]|uniref:Uncharacterized protein n=1 Tax=Haloferula helveola TaxID=490095 RepID=A0ABM7RML3_9BACT|nr:hypothetical protein HAHE_30020 [Haloferula helveola]